MDVLFASVLFFLLQYIVICGILMVWYLGLYSLLIRLSLFYRSFNLKKNCSTQSERNYFSSVPCLSCPSLYLILCILFPLHAIALFMYSL